MSKRLMYAFMAVWLAGCIPDEEQWHVLEGQTMGSTYHVQYLGKDDYAKDVDDLLREINDAVSTYEAGSVISHFNEKGTLSIPLDDDGTIRDPAQQHFFANLEEAYKIFELSGGFFDPTVGVLVEAWGFGKRGHQKTAPDSTYIDSLLLRVGMENIALRATDDTFHIWTKRPGIQLDFSAIAQGYGTDKVFELLELKGVQSMFVEVTGEVRVAGTSPRGDDWVVGINVPQEEAELTEIAARIKLRDASLATSGNYRNYYILDGRKVWHTINPRTGYPRETNLLSATVVHPTCMIADALATACMAQDLEGAIGLLKKAPGAEGYFIYLDEQGNIATFGTERLTKNLLVE